MKTRGVITFVFDDGYKAVYDEVLPLLAKYSVRAVFAVPLEPKGSTIEGQKISSPEKWKQVGKKYGHEIAAHGITHKNLTKLSDTALSEELMAPATTFNATTLVYPGGAFDARVQAEAKKVYSAARSVLFGLETLPPKHMFALKTLNFTRKNFSVARANMYALLAFLQNKWLIETYHMVSSQPSALTHSVLLSDLESHLDFITSLPIAIKTIKEVTEGI